MSLPGLLLFSTPNNRTWRNSGGRCVYQFSRVLGSWGSEWGLRTQTSDLGSDIQPLTTTKSTSTQTQTCRSWSLAVFVIERALHHETIDMPPKKRNSGTPQKKEFKGNMKSESPDSSENAVLSPERWGHTAWLSLK